ncbi:MAG: WD40 repeat domain-containing protein, partial [Ktedonobacteraceae bacterium]
MLKTRLYRISLALCCCGLICLFTACRSSGSPATVPSTTPTTPTTLTAAATPTSTSSELPPATILVYKGHTGIVNTVAWSPNGKRIASGSDDHTVQIWGAATGEMLLTNNDNTMAVNKVAWSPDGKFIASAGEDGTVQVWNATSGKAVYTFRGHTEEVLTVAWSPDGNRI